MKKFKKKRILIIGAKEKTSLEMMYYRAFKTIGANTTLLQIEKNTNNYLLLKIKKIFKILYFFLLRKKLINFFKKNYKNFDIIVVFKGIYLDVATLLACKNFSKKIIWVNIFTDDPFNSQFIKDSNYNLIKTIKYYDFFCIWSRRILKKLKKIIKHDKLIYLPFGYDQFSHFPSQTNSKHKNLITFFGTLDNERAKFLSKIKSINLNVYGNNSHKYKKIFKNSNIRFYPEIRGSNMRNIMSKSLVSINILRKQNKDSHNMKTFEIPAMNCLMLTTRSEEQNILLPENKACYMYSSINEFNIKLNYIKNNLNAISKVKSEGYKIIKKYSYLYRTKKLLNAINKLHN
jgi:hypothetical protein